MNHPDMILNAADQSLLSEAVKAAMDALQHGDKVSRLAAFNGLGTAVNLLSLAEMCAKTQLLRAA